MNLPIQIAIRCAACGSDLKVMTPRVVRGPVLSTEINVAPCQVCLDRREAVATHPGNKVDKKKQIKSFIKQLDADKSQGLRKMTAQTYLRGVLHGLDNVSIDQVLDSLKTLNS